MSLSNSKKTKPAERSYAIKKSDPLYGSLKAVTVGSDQIPSGTKVDCPKPYLDTVAIEMTISGHAANHHQSGISKHSPDSLMLMLPELNFYEIAENGPWHSCWFLIWGKLADNFVFEVARKSTAITVENAPANIRFHMLETCRMILEQPEGWTWNWANHLFTVLNYILRTVTVQSKESHLIIKAKNIMCHNLNSPINLSHISDMLNISLSTLSHTFKTEIGISPAKFFKQLRMDKAKQLLINGMNVKEVSQQLGFDNPFHFSKLFKQVEQIPPSNYKEQNQKPSLRRNTKGTL